MGALHALDLRTNQLTSFNPNGMGALQALYLGQNKLTSLPASIANLSNLYYLNTTVNLISSLPEEITTIDHLTTFFTQYNCLTPTSLSANTLSWLDDYATIDLAGKDWTDRNPGCSTIPNTMYFYGTYPDYADWSQQANWYQDELHMMPITVKSRPDGSDNVIILTDVSANSEALASVKTLEVRDDSIISQPITNTAGQIAPLTTALAGSENDITWTALDPDVTITYAEPVEEATTTVTVSGKDITITPGTKARMTISGTLNNVWVQQTLTYSGQSNNKPQYESLYWDPYSYRYKVPLQ